MSAILSVKKSQNEISDLNTLFKIYCDVKFGNWEKYMENKSFRQIVEELQPKYGLAVFKELVDFVSEYENVQIKDILRDFSKFIHEYY